MQNDVSVLMSAAQSSGLQGILTQLLSDIQLFAVGLSTVPWQEFSYYQQLSAGTACMRK